MVNENTRMYVPEENHQGKRDPSAAPGSPGLPTAGPCGAARAACARGANAVRGSPREPAEEPPCEPERKIPAPPPPRPGFFGACGSHEIPGEGESSPSVGAACISRLCLESCPAGRPGPRQAGERLLRGSLARAGRGGGRARARARASRGDQSRAGGPQAAPRPLFPEPLPRAVRSRSRVGAGAGAAAVRLSAPPRSPSRLLGFSTPPTSPLPLTPSEPTPGVFLLTLPCGLAPEDGSG